MSAGIKGVSAAQDIRYVNKENKLLKSMKFPKEYDAKVDLTRVNWEVMKVWIAQRVTELLGVEDEVLIAYIYEQLEGHKTVDPRKLQVSLTGFLEKNTSLFCKELWVMLASAAANDSGIPQAILDAKAEEVRKRKEMQDAISARLKAEEEKRAEERRQRREEEDKQREKEREARQREREAREKERERGRDRDADRRHAGSPSRGRDDYARRHDRRRGASRSPDLERERRRRRERRSRTRSASPPSELPPPPAVAQHKAPAADAAAQPPSPRRHAANDMLDRQQDAAVPMEEDEHERKKREKREKKERKALKKEKKKAKKEAKDRDRHGGGSPHSAASDSDEGEVANGHAADAKQLEEDLRRRALQNRERL